MFMCYFSIKQRNRGQQLLAQNRSQQHLSYSVGGSGSFELHCFGMWHWSTWLLVHMIHFTVLQGFVRVVKTDKIEQITVGTFFEIETC